jgi:hypothetical protein
VGKKMFSTAQSQVKGAKKIVDAEFMKKSSTIKWQWVGERSRSDTYYYYYYYFLLRFSVS